MERLDGIGAKLDRADEHLHTLRDKAAGLLPESEADPYEVISEYNASTGHCLVHVMVNALPPRFEWGLTAAEWAYHLRSALDQVIWQLVESEGREPKVLRTQFPIYDDPDEFIAHVEKPAPKNKGPLAGFAVGGPAWTLIEAAQPYHASDRRNHYLSALHFLNNTDKHQVLHATFAELHTRPIDKAQAFSPVHVRLITEGESIVTFAQTGSAPQNFQVPCSQVGAPCFPCRTKVVWRRGMIGNYPFEGESVRICSTSAAKLAPNSNRARSGSCAPPNQASSGAKLSTSLRSSSLMVCRAPNVTPVTPSTGKYSYKGSLCDNKVDPVTVMFYNNGEMWSIIDHVEHHTGWNHDSGSPQWYAIHTNPEVCRENSPMAQRASGCGTCDRVHIRSKETYHIDATWRPTSISTPHDEEYVVANGCGLGGTCSSGSIWISNRTNRRCRIGTSRSCSPNKQNVIYNEFVPYGGHTHAGRGSEVLTAMSSTSGFPG